MALTVKLTLEYGTLITRLTVEYDLDPLPVAVAQAHNMLKRLRAMDIDVDVAETVSLRTGLVLPVPYNDNQVVPASRLGPEDSGPGHCHIHWRPEPVKQCCA
jgi:hypothetical protein